MKGKINRTNIYNSIILTRAEEQLKTHFLDVDYNVIKQSSKMIRNVILESKNSPWWMYVKTLSNYIDWVYAHSIDVALISIMIANQLHYSEKVQKDICLGALFHDIGKLLIPKHILQKPGALSDYEMILVKQHCELGYGIIKECGLPESCIQIVLEHHERLDGSGYPNHLTGNQISDYSKIVMVADTFDAITSFRPYKDIGSIEFALQELKKDCNKFDQKIINILCDF